MNTREEVTAPDPWLRLRRAHEELLRAVALDLEDDEKYLPDERPRLTLIQGGRDDA